MSEKIQTEVVVVGSGIVGLAIAASLAKKHDVVVLEKNPKFGQETSSRNSEVIHSGIYYPQSSQKTILCIEGRKKLYEFCQEFSVPFSKCGKYVVATDAAEESYLDKLSEHCRTADVPFENRIGTEINRDENLVRVQRAVYLPETGIIDSHAFMAVLARQASEHGALLAYRNTVCGIELDAAGENHRLEISSPDGDFLLEAPVVINSAGLGAAELSNMALKTSRFSHHYCRGRYFSLTGNFRKKFRSLIYPVPPKDGAGIHVTIDLEGQARLGPDVDWAPQTSYGEVNGLYDCDWDSLKPVFARAAQRYCPSIRPEDLVPGLIGIRPKLFVNEKAHPDFLVEGQNGFIHCLGIESPGLTASLAIAERVIALTS